MSESPSNEADRLLKLLFQAERLQHDRVYYLLVAETIFFLAATTAIKEKEIVVILAIAGITIAVLFAFINIKTYFRIFWLIRRLEATDQIYKEYLNFQNFSPYVEKFGCLLKFLFNRTVYVKKKETSDSTVLTEAKPPVSPRLYDTGVFLALWLPIVIVLAWGFFLIYTPPPPDPIKITQLKF